MTPNTYIIVRTNERIARLEQEIQELDLQKQQSTDNYNLQKATHSDDPAKLKQIEISYIQEQNKLNSQISKKQNELDGYKGTIAAEKERIQNDLNNGIQLDSSGNFISPSLMAPTISSNVLPLDLPKILSAQKKQAAMSPAQKQRSEFNQSWVDPVTGVRWKSKEDYRKWLQSRIEQKYGTNIENLPPRIMPMPRENMVFTPPVMPRENPMFVQFGQRGAMRSRQPV